MKSKVTIEHTENLQFSDLDEGDYFTAPNLTRLFRVRKANKTNSNSQSSINPDYGYAECLDYPGGTFSTASDNCFPNGVNRVDVEIRITPHKR